LPPALVAVAEDAVAIALAARGLGPFYTGRRERVDIDLERLRGESWN
jgi:hypothetical protein